jgi:HAE1 family hydrophobic/amphiphilic exporter-1
VRPIFMSVITSVAGMAPLVLGGGSGSELYRGLGAVVVAGCSSAPSSRSFLTPTLMSLMMDMQAARWRMFGGRGKGGSPSHRRGRRCLTWA